MTRRLLDHNPLTGETCWYDYSHHEDKAIITHEQKVDGILEFAHGKSLSHATAKGIKKDLWHYARVPNSIILEMKTKHGVDFFDKNDEKRMFALLNTEYARFKVTEKTHNVR
jgi:hypothetical protein